MRRHRRDSEEPFLRGLLSSAIHRNPEASMVGIVRAFPMTWWATWSCILLTTSLGVTYLLSGPLRFSSPAFDSARQLFAWAPFYPMRWWAILFLLLAAAEALAIRSSLFVLRLTLRAGATVFLFYAALFLASALRDPRASFGGVDLYLFVAVIHLAAAQTITLITRGARGVQR